MILGVAGDIISAEECRTHYLTKVGGVPWIPSTGCGSGPIGCNWQQASTCGACRRGLSLVFQAYAPIKADDGEYPERVLLVLGCAHPTCGNGRSWRALRCQLPPAAATDTVQQGVTTSCSTRPVQLAPVSALQPPPAPAENLFGAGFDSVDGDETFGGDSSAFDFSDLGVVLEDCASKQQQQRAAVRSGLQQQGAEAAAGAAAAPAAGPTRASEDSNDMHSPSSSVQLAVAGPTLPEFHIIAVEEPSGQKDAMRSADEGHVQRLLEEYERQERIAAGGTLRDHASTARPTTSSSSAQQLTPGAVARATEAGRQAAAGMASASGAAMCGVGTATGAQTLIEGGDDMESWAGEEYEEDHVRGVKAAYLKFSARLARQPDQCARYSRGGDVLWPLREPPVPPRCARCGAPRVLELQLMAPLLAMVLECADWLQGPELARHRLAINAAANWDFATLAVYTCGANCHLAVGEGPLRGDAVMVEEYVALASEEECHVPEELVLAK